MGFLVVAGCANVPRYQFRGPFATVLSVFPHSSDQRVDNLPHLEMVSLPSKSVEESVSATDAVELDSVVCVDTLTHKEVNDSLNLDDSNFRSTDRNRVTMSPWERLSADQVNFYSRDSLLNLALVFGAGAAVANTDADAQLQRHFQSSVRGASSEEWFDYFHSNKELGNGRYTLPIMGVAWLANEYIDGPPAFETFGKWGEQSMRGFIVGAPPLVLMQHVTGGSRPFETPDGSEWHPFRDNNGVSGHAFMSSLPFITAAKMTDNPLAKSLWYVGSTIGPLSRVNDNAHFTSQVGMGWALAFVASTAVQQSDTGHRGWSVVSQAPTGGSGFGLQYRW